MRRGIVKTEIKERITEKRSGLCEVNFLVQIVDSCVVFGILFNFTESYVPHL